MNLEQGIQKAVDQFGKEVIKKKALVSILDDYHAFSIRAHRNVIISLLENGYGEKIYKLDEDNPPDKLLKLKSYAMEAISDDGLGLKENYVYYIIECICYAIGWNDESSPKKSSSKKNTNVCIETSQSHISPSKRALHRVGDCVATIKSSQNRIPVQSKTSVQIKNVNISPNQKNPNLISKNKTSKDIFQFIAIIIMFSILVLIGYYFSSESGEKKTVQSDSIYEKNGNNIEKLFLDNPEMELFRIEPDTFIMGSPKGELGRSTDETQHEVTLTEPYWIGRYEVTQAQYKKVMGVNPSEFKGENLPVERVSWEDAMSFCEKLTEQEKTMGRLPEGYEYTLPTEAQWEYACRAGTTTALNIGENVTNVYECHNMDRVGWYSFNSDNTTHPVGQKKPNAWGLYDMHGNVWEWCLDCYGIYPKNAVIDPVELNTGSFRVLRGGSWGRSASDCRSAYRNYGDPKSLRNVHGFRVALVPSRPKNNIEEKLQNNSEIIPLQSYTSSFVRDTKERAEAETDEVAAAKAKTLTATTADVTATTEYAAQRNAAISSAIASAKSASSEMTSLGNFSTSSNRDSTGIGPSAANYNQYIISLYNRSWDCPSDLRVSEASATVEVKINKDGSIRSSQITKRSGNKSLDESVQRTLDIVAASGVPELPKGVFEPRTLTINFNLKNRLK